MAELALLIVACSAGTYAWRGLGMLVSGSVGIDSEFFLWAGCVAYALIAGLTVRIILLPSGVLAVASLPERIGAALFALLVYFVFRRNLFIGIAAGFCCIVTLLALRSGL